MNKLLMILLLVIGTANADTLRIGLDPMIKPFAYSLPSGELVGFDVDVAKQICKDLHKECEFVQMSWDGLIPALRSGKVDLLITSMSITTEREKVVNFSIPYYKVMSRFMGIVGSTPSPKPVVGVMRGTTDEAYVMSRKDLVNLTYTSQPESILDLAAGRIDYVLGPEIELKAATENAYSKHFVFVGDYVDDLEFYGPGIGIAVNSNNIKLLQEVNESLTKSVIRSPRFVELSQLYFGLNIFDSLNRGNTQ